MAYLPCFLMPILFATSDVAGSIMTIRPLQSSLRFVELQFGQTGPLLMNLQSLQAFSVNQSPAQPSFAGSLCVNQPSESRLGCVPSSVHDLVPVVTAAKMIY